MEHRAGWRCRERSEATGQLQPDITRYNVINRAARSVGNRGDYLTGALAYGLVTSGSRGLLVRVVH